MPRSPSKPTTAACGCASDGRNAERRAVAVDDDIKRANLTHLRRIEGQVRGLIRLVEEDRYCADIITQVSAVRESLQSVAKNLLRNHMKHCASSAIRKGQGDAAAMYDELVDLVGKIAR